MGQSFGKYRLIAELGHGGMADVYLAVAEGPAGTGFNKLQVLKRLKPNLAEDPSFVAMFMDEARLAARVNHPNIVQTNEIGQAGKNYFIAMEYLDGQPLHRVVHRAKAHGGLDQRVHLTILADVLAGLHHAHELADYDGTPLNVVHRDATPQNVFVTYDGFVKVVDFGIAKAARRAVETEHGMVKGKVAYMAPEQLSGVDVDRRADIFVVGIMVWEAATGERMWGDVEHLTIMQRLVNGDIPASPKAAKAEVPEALDKICRRALEADQKKRYATAAEFQRDLNAYLQTVGGRATAEEINTQMMALFADKRKEVRSIIEKQLTTITSPSPRDSIPELEPLSSTLSAESETAPTPDGTAATMQTPASLEAMRKSSPQRAPLYALGGLALVLALAVGWKVTHTTPATTATPAPSTPKDQTIELTVRVTPLDAKITIDDGAALPNPYIGMLKRDEWTHVVRATAPGYKPDVRTVSFRDSAMVDISLMKEDVAPALPTASQARVETLPTGGKYGGGARHTTTVAAPTSTVTETHAAPVTTEAQPGGDLHKRPPKIIDPNNPYSQPGTN